MIDFLSGVVALASAGIALFFLRYWRDTGDRLFAIFSLAFAIFATNRVVLTILDEDDEARDYVYLIRLAAFVLILVAILDKNRGARARDG
jgi:membrane protein CcdC involved in cytochrome C biogenesis